MAKLGGHRPNQEVAKRTDSTVERKPEVGAAAGLAVRVAPAMAQGASRVKNYDGAPRPADGPARPRPFTLAFAERGNSELVDPDGFVMLTNNSLDVVISKKQCDAIGIKCQEVADAEHPQAWDASLKDPEKPGVTFHPLLSEENFLTEDAMCLPLHQDGSDSRFGYVMTLGQTALYEKKKWVCIPIEIGLTNDDGGRTEQGRAEALERASAEATRLAPLLDKVGGMVLGPIKGDGDATGGDTAAWVMALLPMKWAQAQFEASHSQFSEEARNSNWPDHEGWANYRQSVIDLFEGREVPSALNGLNPWSHVTPAEKHYIQSLERLWDIVSEAVESGRISKESLPADYQAIVDKMADLSAQDQVVNRSESQSGAAGFLTMSVFENDTVNFLPTSEEEASRILAALNVLKVDDPEVIRRLVHFSKPDEFAAALPKILDEMEQEVAEQEYCSRHDL